MPSATQASYAHKYSQQRQPAMGGGGVLPSALAAPKRSPVAPSSSSPLRRAPVEAASGNSTSLSTSAAMGLNNSRSLAASHSHGPPNHNVRPLCGGVEDTAYRVLGVGTLLNDSTFEGGGGGSRSGKRPRSNGHYASPFVNTHPKGLPPLSFVGSKMKKNGRGTHHHHPTHSDQYVPTYLTKSRAAQLSFANNQNYSSQQHEQRATLSYKDLIRLAEREALEDNGEEEDREGGGGVRTPFYASHHSDEDFTQGFQNYNSMNTNNNNSNANANGPSEHLHHASYHHHHLHRDHRLGRVGELPAGPHQHHHIAYAPRLHDADDFDNSRSPSSVARAVNSIAALEGEEDEERSRYTHTLHRDVTSHLRKPAVVGEGEEEEEAFIVDGNGAEGVRHHIIMDSLDHHNDDHHHIASLPSAAAGFDVDDGILRQMMRPPLRSLGHHDSSVAAAGSAYDDFFKNNYANTKAANSAFYPLTATEGTPAEVMPAGVSRHTLLPFYTMRDQAVTHTRTSSQLSPRINDKDMLMNGDEAMGSCEDEEEEEEVVVEHVHIHHIHTAAVPAARDDMMGGGAVVGAEMGGAQEASAERRREERDAERRHQALVKSSGGGGGSLVNVVHHHNAESNLAISQQQYLPPPSRPFVTVQYPDPNFLPVVVVVNAAAAPSPVATRLVNATSSAPLSALPTQAKEMNDAEKAHTSVQPPRLMMAVEQQIHVDVDKQMDSIHRGASHEGPLSQEERSKRYSDAGVEAGAHGGGNATPSDDDDSAIQWGRGMEGLREGGQAFYSCTSVVVAEAPPPLPLPPPHRFIVANDAPQVVGGGGAAGGEEAAAAAVTTAPSATGMVARTDDGLADDAVGLASAVPTTVTADSLAATKADASKMPGDVVVAANNAPSDTTRTYVHHHHHYHHHHHHDGNEKGESAGGENKQSLLLTQASTQPAIEPVAAESAAASNSMSVVTDDQQQKQQDVDEARRGVNTDDAGVNTSLSLVTPFASGEAKNGAEAVPTDAPAVVEAVSTTSVAVPNDNNNIRGTTAIVSSFTRRELLLRQIESLIAQSNTYQRVARGAIDANVSYTSAASGGAGEEWGGGYDRSRNVVHHHSHQPPDHQQRISTPDVSSASVAISAVPSTVTSSLISTTDSEDEEDVDHPPNANEEATKRIARDNATRQQLPPPPSASTVTTMTTMSNSRSRSAPVGKTKSHTTATTTPSIKEGVVGSTHSGCGESILLSPSLNDREDTQQQQQEKASLHAVHAQQQRLGRRVRSASANMTLDAANTTIDRRTPSAASSFAHADNIAYDYDPSHYLTIPDPHFNEILTKRRLSLSRQGSRRGSVDGAAMRSVSSASAVDGGGGGGKAFVTEGMHTPPQQGRSRRNSNAIAGADAIRFKHQHIDAATNTPALYSTAFDGFEAFPTTHRTTHCDDVNGRHPNAGAHHHPTVSSNVAMHALPQQHHPQQQQHQHRFRIDVPPLIDVSPSPNRRAREAGNQGAPPHHYGTSFSSSSSLPLPPPPPPVVAFDPRFTSEQNRIVRERRGAEDDAVSRVLELIGRGSTNSACSSNGGPQAVPTAMSTMKAEIQNKRFAVKY